MGEASMQVVDAGVASILVRMGWGIATMFLVSTMAFVAWWIIERHERRKAQAELAKALDELANERKYAAQQRALRKKVEAQLAQATGQGGTQAPLGPLKRVS